MGRCRGFCFQVRRASRPAWPFSASRSSREAQSGGEGRWGGGEVGRWVGSSPVQSMVGEIEPVWPGGRFERAFFSFASYEGGGCWARLGGTFRVFASVGLRYCEHLQQQGLPQWVCGSSCVQDLRCAGFNREPPQQWLVDTGLTMGNFSHG